MFLAGTVVCAIAAASAQKIGLDANGNLTAFPNVPRLSGVMDLPVEKSDAPTEKRTPGRHERDAMKYLQLKL